MGSIARARFSQPMVHHTSLIAPLVVCPPCWQWMQSSKHCDVVFSPIVDQIGVGVWPKYSNSYYWTIDVGTTWKGPDAITSSPIYEGVHYHRLHPLTGEVYQIYFMVSDIVHGGKLCLGDP